ncbi:YncE family protein [Streptomyces sp. NRRL F-2664]|uniref:YncE family protein n=1 Tax=Streptomyces sp. NRRL F-2664 TaxID=1463842 RepID=UPI00131CE572|nr:YncE family protein [Streptomyces sp. NRRL F-2664]
MNIFTNKTLPLRLMAAAVAASAVSSIGVGVAAAAEPDERTRVSSGLTPVSSSGWKSTEIPFFQFAGDVAMSSDGERAFVGHWYGLDIVDTASSKVVDTFDSVKPGSGQLAVSSDGKKLYSIQQPEYDVAASEIAVIDPMAGTRMGDIPLGAGVRPISIALSPDGSKLYVATRGEGPTKIKVVNTATNEIRNIDLGNPNMPAGCDLSISPDGSRLYIHGGSEVLAVDTSSGDLHTMGTVASARASIKTSADGSYVYVSGNVGDTSYGVQVIAADSGKVAATIDTPATVSDMAMSADGKTLFATMDNGAVLEIDTNNHSVRDTLETGGNAVRSRAGTAVTPDGNRLFVANSRLESDMVTSFART